MGRIYVYLCKKCQENKKAEADMAAQFPIQEEDVFFDCFKEGDANRPMFEKLVESVNKGDLVYIKSLDDLGDTFCDIHERWERLTRDKQADVAVLDYPALDTRRGQGFMNGALSEAVSEMLSFADRHNKKQARERQAKGYLAGKERGVQFGRPPKPLPDNFNEMRRKWEDGKITESAAAEACGMPLSTFRYRAKQLEVCESA